MRVSVSKRRRPNGTRGTPERRQGVHTTPWQCTLCHACQAKGRRPNDTSGTPEGRHGIHPTPANARCATPATPEGRQRDARAYIRPLGNAHCATCQCTLCNPCHARRRKPNGTRGTPEGRQGVHPTPCQCTLCHACHAKAAESK